MADQADAGSDLHVQNTVEDKVAPTSSFRLPPPLTSGLTQHNVLWLDLRTQATGDLLIAIRSLGVGIFEVRNATSALDALTTQSYAAAVLCGSYAEIEPVIGSIRSQKELNTLPIMVLCTDVKSNNPSDLYDIGATDVLSLDTSHREVLSRLAAHLRAVANWTQLVDMKVRERSALSQALSQVSPQATPELTADVICFELSLVRKFAGVAIVSFSYDGGAFVLAHHGQAMSEVAPGTAFSDSIARYLREHASNGPWIEQFNVGVPLGNTGAPGGRLGPDFASAAAVAPLTTDGEILGLLMLSNEPGRPANGTNMAETISAAIDFARVTVGLLGPGLRERDNTRARKLGLDVVIAERRFIPVYQPIVELSSNKTIGFEALCRFNDNTRPDIRFAEAARVGVGKQLELTVLDEAIRQAKALPPQTFLSINVSPFVLLSYEELADVLKNADRPLTIELTEHDRVDDYTAVRHAVAQLGPGVRLSVDDAGSGFASLRHVLALEPDFVKLDQSWVSGVHTDPARRALVAGLQHFADETGCALIAEGIEHEVELETLRELQVLYGQGYYLSRPQPVSEFQSV